MVLSKLALASVFPLGLKATYSTDSECALIVRTPIPVETSHRVTDLSSEPTARFFPAGLNATDNTEANPLSVRNCVPFERSHSTTFLPCRRWRESYRLD